MNLSIYKFRPSQRLSLYRSNKYIHQDSWHTLNAWPSHPSEAAANMNRDCVCWDFWFLWATQSWKVVIAFRARSVKIKRVACEFFFCVISGSIYPARTRSWRMFMMLTTLTRLLHDFRTDQQKDQEGRTEGSATRMDLWSSTRLQLPQFNYDWLAANGRKCARILLCFLDQLNSHLGQLYLYLICVWVVWFEVESFDSL